MIRPIAFATLLLASSLPALAQSDPGAASPLAPDTGAPKPYTPPAGTTDQTGEAPPVAPAITNVPPVDPEMQKAAEGLATQIEDVQVVGPWTDGDQSGVWRTVMMQVGQPDKDVYRFFVQKLDRVGPNAKVISTTEVKEVAGVAGTVVGYRADEAETEEGESAPAKDLTLFFDVVPSNGEVSESYELHFMNDLTYTFGPASN
ncbi:hypothetical protein [Aureimonas leprariae]|uniref:DNA topoisomerase IV subunit B n=1 Tax=Plantimonas leprariae TaxID=2615207 RepID=A0A7V7PS26_9HYPH|nr:hypothetical protein [Aureimonas leprariae]KAB0681802.1 hypothetical protein F6X38_02970 [Aureimonas leprariae]